MTNIIVNPAGFKAKQNALSFGKQGKRITSGAGGTSNPISKLDNILFWVDASDPSTITTTGGNVVTQIISKDPDERVVNSLNSTITLVDGVLVGTGDTGQELEHDLLGTADPLFQATVATLTFSLLLRCKALANENREVFRGGYYGGSVDGVQINGDQFRIRGDADAIIASWTNISGITQTLRGPKTQFDNLLLVFDGDAGTCDVYFNDETGQVTGFVPDTDETYNGFQAIDLMRNWTGELEQAVITSDVITPEEFGVFKAFYAS